MQMLTALALLLALVAMGACEICFFFSKKIEVPLVGLAAAELVIALILFAVSKNPSL